MNILHLFSISIIILSSLYPVFALETPQTCDTSILPHRWPSSHIYVTDTNESLPYVPLIDHTAIFHDDDVWNTFPEPRTVQVTLAIQNPDGKLVFNQTQSLQMQACSGPESVKWRFVPIQIAYYTATVSDDRGKVGMDFYSMLDASKSQTVSSPLEQLRFGIDSHNVICRQDLHLVIKSENGSPACAKLQTAEKLVERGWALNPKLTHMNIKVFSSYTPSSLTDHFLTGSLYSSAEPIQNGNITVTVNGAVMGTTQTYPNRCFQFHNWNDSRLTDQIHKSISLGMSSMELNFQTQYFGDSNHNPANASATSYLNFYAVPLAPAQYDTEVYPSNQINVTQGDSAQFHIIVKPFSKYWEVGHMKLNLQRMPCGLSYHISPVDNNDSVLVNNTSRFDMVMDSTNYTPSGKYWISIDQDLRGINEPNIDSNVGAFFLNVLKK